MNNPPIFVHSTLDDLTDLSPNAMRVYMHLARRANKAGEAWPSYQAIGDHCFGSISDKPATRKTFARNAINELIVAGLLSKENRTRDDGGQTSNAYIVLSPALPGSTPVLNNTPVDGIAPPVLNIHTPCLNSSPRAYQAPEDNPIEDQSNEGTPGEEERETRARARPLPPPPQHPSVEYISPGQEMYGAVCEILGVDYKVITGEKKVQIAQAVTILRDAGYTLDDLHRFLREVWFKDWRWQKYEQRPTLTQLREEIGKLRAGIPVDMPAARNNGKPLSRGEQTMANFDEYRRLKAAGAI